jgi:hypothetical protein
LYTPFILLHAIELQTTSFHSSILQKSTTTKH